jgi:hypothetical protein
MTKPKSFGTWTTEKQEEWREKQREIQRQSYQRNPQKAHKNCARWRKNNPEKLREIKESWRKLNTDKINRSRYFKRMECPEIKKQENLRYRNQKAADQFFIMAGAAEQLSKLQPNQTDQ